MLFPGYFYKTPFPLGPLPGSPPPPPRFDLPLLKQDFDSRVTLPFLHVDCKWTFLPPFFCLLLKVSNFFFWTPFLSTKISPVRVDTIHQDFFLKFFAEIFRPFFEHAACSHSFLRFTLLRLFHLEQTFFRPIFSRIPIIFSPHLGWVFLPLLEPPKPCTINIQLSPHSSTFQVYVPEDRSSNEPVLCVCVLTGLAFKPFSEFFVG